MSTRAFSMPGLLITWIALTALAVLSWGLSYENLGQFETPAAVIIAFVKAALVVLIFLELIGQSFASRTALTVGVVFIALLATLLSVDILTRPIPPAYTPPTAGGWLGGGSAAE